MKSKHASCWKVRALADMLHGACTPPHAPSESKVKGTCHSLTKSGLMRTQLLRLSTHSDDTLPLM